MEKEKKAKRDTATQKGPKAAGKPKPKANRGVYLAVALLVVLIALVGAFLYLSRPTQTFQSFRHDFDTAPRVSIYVQDYNSSFYVSAEDCATTLVQQIVSNSTVRRASATINFYVDTPTDCYYSEGLGSTSGNLINTTLQDCIGQSQLVPSILLNYSPSNSTQVEGRDLVVQGSAAYLAMCGISSEIP